MTWAGMGIRTDAVQCERACAGWLATEGVNHPTVRLAVGLDQLPACSLTPGADWPALHPDFGATRRHDQMEDS